MIKVYDDGEWVMTFNTYEEYNHWIQNSDAEELNMHTYEFEYIEEEE